MALGKRKERSDEDEASEKPEQVEQPEKREHHGSTLFVSNLPYNATSTDLQTLFSDIAPVRNAFVVCEHGTGVSKGVGYVSFAIREDAQMAYDKISKETLTLVGRKLRVQWAEQKPKVKNAPTSTQTEPSKKKPRGPQPGISKPQDPLAIRTIVISGLPATIDSKSLWKKIRKYSGAEKVEWPMPIEGGGQDTSIAHAIFSTPSSAQDAVTKLHAHVFKGSLLSVTLKKRVDTLASHHKTTKAAASTPTSTEPTFAPNASHAAPNHANRLIVRNLPFTATEQDLRTVFLPHGPIYEIKMPLKVVPDATTEKTETTEVKAEDEEGGEGGKNEQLAAQPQESQQTNKGFAFIWFYSRKDAENAMEKCNGMLFRAGAAEELVKGKQKRKKDRRLEKKRQGKQENAKAEEEDEDEAHERDRSDEEDKEVKVDKNERIIAVDWALSKNRWEEEKAKIEEEMNKHEGEEDDDESVEAKSDDEDGSSIASSEDEDTEGGLGVHDDSEQGSEDDKEDDEDDEEGDDEDDRDEEDKPVKPQLPQTDIGTTLFIRNIPYDTTEDELRTLFRSFGPLRYARITLDPSTGRSRGTGFACFWNREDADKVIEQSELLRAETTGGNVVPAPKKKNPFTLPSILAPDPSSSLAQNLVLHGRALDVVRAVTRDEAGKLKEAGERAREKADKRNMYLLREGVILPNTPEASSLSPPELERRTKSYNARRTLLKSNPSLYISKTRLSVRQIPLYVTDVMLKRLALHAVRAFEREVGDGKRPGLSEAELADLGWRPGQEQAEERTQAKPERQSHGDASDNESEATSTSKNVKRKTRFGKKFGNRRGVKQAKIIRQADRVDPITGKGRSRGYGFVEMYTHADALRVLRWANNNPAVQVLMRTWWREELERMIKTERERKTKAKDDEKDEDGGARLKRMVSELEKQGEPKEPKSGGTGVDEEATRKNRGTLIVEFSIENVQVVQRRETIQKNKIVQKPTEETTGKKMLDDGRLLHQRNRPASREPREHSPSRTSSARLKGKRGLEEERELGRKQHAQKKRRLSESTPPTSPSKLSGSEVHDTKAADQEAPKLGQKLGSLIGRRRKQRRAKGKGK